MKVFATNWLESITDDVDGGANWNWSPNRPMATGPTGYDGTGPGAPTKTLEPTRGGSDQLPDADVANEAMGGGMQVA